MNKVLIITYYWPPGSGAGVQRWLKFAKYLPGAGWEPLILTVDPEYAAYPASDCSLLDEIATGLKVYRTRATDWFRIYKKDKTKIPAAGFAANDNNTLTGNITRFIRGNFFIPDPRRGWNKYAIREAARLIESEGIGHIITTSPPHSTQLIGLKLKKRFPEIIWLADLRDPWTEIYYYGSFFHTSAARIIDERYEKKVLKTADKVITVGESLKNSYCKRISGIDSKTEVITNGYDESDFEDSGYEAADSSLISYIGTLSDAYPLKGFIDAVSDLTSRGQAIRLVFVGTVSPGQKNLIESKIDSSVISFIPYVNHRDAIRYMRESSVLLLIIPEHFSSKSIITGKLFEYLASKRPILCLGPEDGDAADILRKTGNGKCVEYNDTEGICTIIEEFITTAGKTALTAPKEFSRANLTKKLASLLDDKI